MKMTYKQLLFLIIFNSIFALAAITLQQNQIQAKFWILRNLNIFNIPVVLLINNVLIFIISLSLAISVQQYNKIQYIICMIICIWVVSYNSVQHQPLLNSLNENTQDLDNLICKQESYPLFYKMDLFQIKYGQELCSENCPCNVDKNQYPGQDIVENKDEMIVNNILKCKDSNLEDNQILPDLYNSEVSGRFYQLMEDMWSCAGICTQSPFQLFNGLENGPPKSMCKSFIIESANQYQRIIGFVNISTIVTSFILFLSLGMLILSGEYCGFRIYNFNEDDQENQDNFID